MKTQITYRKLDGGESVALVNGSISETMQAKRELANWLELPSMTSGDGVQEDLDGRLRQGGIAPESVQFNHISE
ncbi:hypothetical protein G6F57_012767 [Rhizopus arrhizus]|jgi:hypothetical protein|uniref:hypothetical protein n=1 Tax=Achromobacter marplatensis TaxID=470868 RepID=UPI003C74E325|nr:hypothetical protein G6F59_018269 [Rhizopus arrhizus]KAG1468022.1 hypothetical protein G6F57_012767 [Rhizopus arrhizus]